MRHQFCNWEGNGVRLSVLDAAAIGPDVTAEQAITSTLELAKAAEDLGYYRLWLAEHHSTADSASSAPAVLIAHLAEHTTKIRLGSGGALLLNHAPLAIAEQFITLAALYPGRIDLGVGGGKGGPLSAALALRRASTQQAANNFSCRLDELADFLTGGSAAGHPYNPPSVLAVTESPPVYVLGSDVAKAETAASRGLPFVFAQHLAPQLTSAAIDAYRSSFRPREALIRPYVILTSLVVCASTQSEAERAAVGATMIRVRRILARRQQRPFDAKELTDPALTEDEAWIINETLGSGGVLVGDPNVVCSGLKKLCVDTEPDEIMICFMEYDGSARIRTLASLLRGVRLSTDYGQLSSPDR